MELYPYQLDFRGIMFTMTVLTNYTPYSHPFKQIYNIHLIYYTEYVTTAAISDDLVWEVYKHS